MHNEPLRITWIPSHVLEGIPIAEITEQQAQACRSTCQDILGNRTADFAAKQAALANSPIFAHHPQVFEQHLNGKNGWYTLGVTRSVFPSDLFKKLKKAVM